MGCILAGTTTASFSLPKVSNIDLSLSLSLFLSLSHAQVSRQPLKSLKQTRAYLPGCRVFGRDVISRTGCMDIFTKPYN